MDDKLVTPTSGFVECSLVPVMEGYQEKEDVSIARNGLFNMLSCTKYYPLVLNLQPLVVTCSPCMARTT